MKFSRILKIIACSVLISVALIGGIAYRTICKTIYRREYTPEQTHKMENDRNYLEATYGAEPITFPTSDGLTLAGLFIQRPNAKRVILMCHGYYLSKEYMKRYVALFPEDSILLFDFRAHGQSEGNLISLGNLERNDVRAAVTFLHEQPATRDLPIIGVGLSMGGATLLGAAAQGVQFKALIIDSSFANLYEQVSNSFGLYTGLPKTIFMPVIVMMYEYLLGCSALEVSPMRDIAKINCPVLLIHSEDDATTFVGAVHKLYSAAQEPKQLWLLEHAKHGFILHEHPQEYAHYVHEFLMRYG
jgi:uncharacterized protein